MKTWGTCRGPHLQDPVPLWLETGGFQVAALHPKPPEEEERLARLVRIFP